METLPPPLAALIGSALASASSAQLQGWGNQLSTAYRDETFSLSPQQCLAYLTVRLPATYAVLRTVLKKLKLFKGEGEAFKTLLDVGTGPGTALWAYQETFQGLEAFTGVDQSATFLRHATKLLEPFSSQCVVTLEQRNFLKKGSASLAPHELVILSYILNELSLEAAKFALTEAWRLSTSTLVLVEPGTSKCFEKFLVWREHLIQLGAFIWAPCPHLQACPLANNPTDWCHVHVRLPRSRRHQSIKQGTLAWEDEPYLYLIASKTPCPQTSWSRVLHTPQKNPAHLRLSLCQPDGTCGWQILTKKKDAARYQQARKVKWGDLWPSVD
ncbi:MAG: small ribosomal subunit Rsm22 family protein [Alphaproteobacteria bacterium]